MLQSSKPGNDVVITGAGMVTPLGLDALTSCAAARAGLVRTAVLSNYSVRSSEDGEPEGLDVHQASLLTAGFEGNARLLRLTAGALSDFYSQMPEVPREHFRTDFYLSLPDPHRCFTGLELIADEGMRAARLREARRKDPGLELSDIATGLIAQAAGLSNWPSEPVVRFATGSGHAGVAEALAAGLRDLNSGVCETAIIGGVDSLLDEETLEWLEATGRLKTPDNPVGVRPGEAAAFFAVRRKRTVDSAPTLVSAVELDVESQSLLVAGTPTGLGLANVIARASAMDRAQPPAQVWAITDQNGEPYRAIEWADAQVRLIPRFPFWSTPVLWFPAVSFGDTGAASGAVSICVAWAGFGRQYAPGATAFVISSSDASTRACILLERDTNGV